MAVVSTDTPMVVSFLGAGPSVGMSGDVFAEGRVHARLITFAAAPALAFEPLDHIRVDPQCQAPLDRPKEPAALSAGPVRDLRDFAGVDRLLRQDRKSTRLNSSH